MMRVKDELKRNKDILKSTKGVETIKVGKEIEGKDFLNLSRDSEVELGKLMSYGHPLNPPITTIIGKVGNIRAVMDFLNTPGYPIEYIRKQRLTREEVRKVPRKKVEVPNYWAAVTYFVWERIKQHGLVDAIDELPENIKLTCYNVIENDVNGIKSEIIKFNYNMNNYVAIFRLLKKIIQTSENVEEMNKKVNSLILDIRQDKNKGVFEDTPALINVDEEALFKLD